MSSIFSYFFHCLPTISSQNLWIFMNQTFMGGQKFLSTIFLLHQFFDQNQFITLKCHFWNGTCITSFIRAVVEWHLKNFFSGKMPLLLFTNEICIFGALFLPLMKSTLNGTQLEVWLAAAFGFNVFTVHTGDAWVWKNAAWINVPKRIKSGFFEIGKDREFVWVKFGQNFYLKNEISILEESNLHHTNGKVRLLPLRHVNKIWKRHIVSSYTFSITFQFPSSKLFISSKNLR